MCVLCVPNECYFGQCSRKKAKKPPAIAFMCSRCGEDVSVDELEDGNCFETPDKQLICSMCVDTMSVRDALAFLGCLVIWERGFGE